MNTKGEGAKIIPFPERNPVESKKVGNGGGIIVPFRKKEKPKDPIIEDAMKEALGGESDGVKREKREFWEPNLKAAKQELEILTERLATVTIRLNNCEEYLDVKRAWTENGVISFAKAKEAMNAIKILRSMIQEDRERMTVLDQAIAELIDTVERLEAILERVKE